MNSVKRNFTVALIVLLTIGLFSFIVDVSGDTTATFGTTTVGSSSATLFSGIPRANQYTPSSSGTLTNIMVYFTGTGNAQVAIYADNAGSPYTVLAYSANESISSDGWHDFSGFSLAITSGTTYWLAAQSDSENLYWNYTVGGANYCQGYGSYGTFLNPYLVQSTGNYNVSIYGVYTVTSPTPTPSPSPSPSPSPTPAPTATPTPSPTPAPTAGPTIYTYQFNGPYWDTGYSATGNTILCQVLWANASIYSFSLNADGISYPNSTSIVTSTAIQHISWNVSSALNLTRTIDFRPSETSGTWILRITNPSYPSFIYTFPVTDFFGMTSPYLRVTHSDNGTDQYPIEQRDLSALGTPSFVLQQYQIYTFTFLCSQGTYSQQFTAENTYTQTLAVMSGCFNTTTTAYPTTTIQRLNSSMIGIYYSDPGYATSALYVSITHKSGSTVILDYNLVTSGNTATILWNKASSGVSYNVNVTSVVNSVNHVWLTVASSEAATNPFTGVFDFLGQTVPTMPYVSTGWPEGMTSANIAQLIGASIVMMFLCIGSFKSAGACCMLSWIIFGILIYLGWLGIASPYAIPQFAISGFIGILIMIDEGKRDSREI